MRLGVDFGTTNSTVSLYDGETLHPIKVDPKNDNPYVMPSLFYIDRRGKTTVGAAAADVYLRRETGRPVRWRRRDAGEIEITVASLENDPIEFTQQVSVLVDVAARGRLLQSIKTGLFNNRYSGTRIFNQFYPLENLIAIVLGALKSAAERDLSEPCDTIMMGRPVRFSENDLADSRAESVLLKAAYIAGFKDVTLELEPVGVTHLYHRSSEDRQTVLVFDFGGGTLDLTVARVGGTTPPEILATQGVLVGGDDLDRAIMAWLLPHFGGGSDGILPPQMTDKLRSWQTMPELSQPHYLERIRRLRKTVADPVPLLALETLVTRNVGFKLFKEIERTKKILSEQTSAVIDFEYEHINLKQTLTRRRFERIIAPHVERVNDGVMAVLRRANTRPQDVDVVLRTGGSSLVPAFTDLLVEIFGEEKQRLVDPLVSVGGGFAVAAYEYRPPEVVSPEVLVSQIKSIGGRSYALQQTALGVRGYADRDFVISRLPYNLHDLPFIQIPNSENECDAESFIHFHLSEPARVYVAYESTVQRLPDWLNGFTPESMQIDLVEDYALINRTMNVYGRDYPAGEVVLGGNMAKGYDGSVILHYLVIIQPKSRVIVRP